MIANKKITYPYRSVDDIPGMLQIWLCAFAIFLLTSPFASLLTGADPSIGAVKDFATLRSAEGSQWPIYATRALSLGIAFFFATRNVRHIRRSINALWPIGLYFFWAFTSLSWTDSFTTTLNALVSFSMLITASYLIAVQFSPRDLARTTLYSGALMAIVSIAYVIVLPHYGMHNADDAAQSVHAGTWRGVYPHKNHLGQMAAIYAVGALMSGKNIMPRWHSIAIFVLMMLLVTLSTSASAIAIIVLAPFIVWVSIGLNTKQRVLSFFFIIIAVIIGYMTISAVLEALGRDLTFTGRTTIWAIAMEALSENPLIGYGFLSPTYGDFTYSVQSVMGVTDPHSSYFDILLGLGSIGLALFVLPVVCALASGRRLFVGGGSGRQCALIMCSMMVAWLLAGLTEANSRPFVSMFAIGIFSMMIMVKRLPSSSRSSRHRPKISSAHSGLPTPVSTKFPEATSMTEVPRPEGTAWPDWRGV